MKDTRVIVAQRLRDRMAEVGAKQDDLASIIGCSQGAISQILNGRTSNSRYLPKIAAQLAVSVDWLLGRSELKDPSAIAAGTQPISVSMQVLLPSEATLTEMFAGMLDTIDGDLSSDARARALARRLPIALARLSTLLLMPGTVAAPVPSHSDPSAAGTP